MNWRIACRKNPNITTKHQTCLSKKILHLSVYQNIKKFSGIWMCTALNTFEVWGLNKSCLITWSWKVYHFSCGNYFNQTAHIFHHSCKCMMKHVLSCTSNFYKVLGQIPSKSEPSVFRWSLLEFSFWCRKVSSFNN